MVFVKIAHPKHTDKDKIALIVHPVVTSAQRRGFAHNVRLVIGITLLLACPSFVRIPTICMVEVANYVLLDAIRVICLVKTHNALCQCVNNASKATT